MPPSVNSQMLSFEPFEALKVMTNDEQLHVIKSETNEMSAKSRKLKIATIPPGAV